MSEEILIGEGVMLDARPASFATRAVAAIIDATVLFIASVGVLSVVDILTGFTNTAAGEALMLGFYVVLFIGVPTLVETLTRGRSLGKLMFGLRIVRDDGGPTRFRHSIIRALVGFFELWMLLGSVALITSLLHPKGKRVGDVLAGTYAIRIRGGAPSLAPLMMPPELALWARRADMRRLPDGLALSARQFLGRAPLLHPASRARLGMDLASQVEAYVAPGPVPGTHPERFLAAVLAERRDRELNYLLRVSARTSEEERQVARLPHGVPDPHQ